MQAATSFQTDPLVIHSAAPQRVLGYDGAFRLVRRIANGGMATVYEAEQMGAAGFAKRVALKVIDPRLARRREWLQLFIDEAKLSANLVHGNIIQIYQLGEVDGTYFIAMEYIRGPTLRMMVDRHREMGEPIPFSLAAYITSRVCRALDFAHGFVAPDGQRLDIVHRDIAPGNVMAAWDGHIKLGDFGIAKANTSIDLAASGIRFIGKKHYVSPEQALGLEVDARSDIFSLGVLLYELLAMKPLFSEEVTELALDKIAMDEIPRMASHLPGLPVELERILEHALERDPANRPTAAEMGGRLDHWCERQNVVPSPDRLQDHLTSIFPDRFRAARTPTGAMDATNFSALRPSWRGRSRAMLRRLFGGL
jgi:serine/threonine-protein kinase